MPSRIQEMAIVATLYSLPIELRDSPLAIRFQTSLEPYEVSFETNNNASSLSRGEFKYREKWYDAPVKFSPAVPPYSFGSKLYGNYIKVGLTYNKAEKQENRGFILKSKIRTRFSNT